MESRINRLIFYRLTGKGNKGRKKRFEELTDSTSNHTNKLYNKELEKRRRNKSK